MKSIKIIGFDPAFATWGTAKGRFILETDLVFIDEIHLVRTAKAKKKTVRASSDRIRRGREIVSSIKANCKDAQIIFSEIPTGTKSAVASMSLGIAVGILSSISIPVIQILPNHTKLASVGSKTATKKEMINWATNKYPSLPWSKNKSTGKWEAKNEHMADAIAVIHAGIQTDQFHQLLQLYREGK